MLLRNAQLSTLVGEIVERVVKGQRIEDSKIEAKSKWIESIHAARQLAAHANAARGQEIVWIIGLKEGKGVEQIEPMEAADWFAQVCSHFDGPFPRMYDLEVSTIHGNVRALAFSTAEAPYVISARPAEGQKAPEILWREGTALRHARRADLLRMLVPQTALPHLEAMKATLFAHDRDGPASNIVFHGDLYVTLISKDEVVLPLHRQSLTIIGSTINLPLERVEISAPLLTRSNPRLEVGDHEVILNGPAMLHIAGHAYLPTQDLVKNTHLQILVEFQRAAQPEVATVTIPIEFAPNSQYPFRYILPGRPWE